MALVHDAASNMVKCWKKNWNVQVYVVQHIVYNCELKMAFLYLLLVKQLGLPRNLLQILDTVLLLVMH